MLQSYILLVQYIIFTIIFMLMLFFYSFIKVRESSAFCFVRVVVGKKRLCICFYYRSKTSVFL